MSRPQAKPPWIVRCEPSEPLRVASAGQQELAQQSVDDVVARACAYLLENGRDLAVYDRVSITFYPERLPDYSTAAVEGAAWLLWFWLRLAPGIDLFPDYTEVIVRDPDGAVWEPAIAGQRKSRGKHKKTATG